MSFFSSSSSLITHRTLLDLELYVTSNPISLSSAHLLSQSRTIAPGTVMARLNMTFKRESRFRSLGQGSSILVNGISLVQRTVRRRIGEPVNLTTVT